MSEILLVTRDRAGMTVEVQTLMAALDALGIRYSLFCRTVEDEWAERVRRSGGQVHATGIRRPRLFDDIVFRSKFLRLARTALDDGRAVWVFGMDAVRALRGLPDHERLKYAVHVQELYDTLPFYRWLMRRTLPRARAVIVPETARAFIIRSWCRLPETPFILPNKSLHHPRTPRMEIEDPRVRESLARAGGRKLVLYQTRCLVMDLAPVGRALHELRDRFAFGFLGDPGKGPHFDRLRAACPGVIQLGYIPPPEHLRVTSHAACGLLLYDYRCLNFVFCAPNKTWEYAGFGIPMLCNHLPMIEVQFRTYGAGEVFELDRPESVAAALERIEAGYDRYIQGSTDLYESVDVLPIIARILDAIGVRTHIPMDSAFAPTR